MSHFASRLKEEIRGIIPPAVFFFVAFHLLAFTRSLMLEEYGIEVSTSLEATVGALIVAKVVLLADLLPFVNRFPDRPLVYNAVWKTVIYFVTAMMVRYLEHLFDFWRQYHDLVVANRHLLDELVWPHFWGVQIWLLVLFFFYTSARELVRVLGAGRVKSLFLGPLPPDLARNPRA